MRHFLNRLLIFIAVIAILPGYILLYNLYYDPFGVIWGDMENQYTEPNQRYLKVKHLIANPDKYDSYIMGSSRAGKIDPRNIEAEGIYYNLSYTEGIPIEHLEDLRLMIEHGVDIKRVIIGIDNISYLIGPEGHRKESLRKRYISWNDPLMGYLFLKPDKKLLKKITKIKQSEQQAYYDIYNYGIPISNFKDKWVTDDSEKHCNKEMFNEPAWNNNYKERIDKSIDEISELVLFCNKNEIELTFFTNPMHVTTYLYLDMEVYYKFLRNVVDLSPVYDFSGINDITTDNFWYYETSHFRPVIGDRMADIMIEGKLDNFGQYVTKRNIDEVISKKKKEIEDYLSFD